MFSYGGAIMQKAIKVKASLLNELTNLDKDVKRCLVNLLIRQLQREEDPAENASTDPAGEGLAS